jgi:hypothetical protein
LLLWGVGGGGNILLRVYRAQLHGIVQKMSDVPVYSVINFFTEVAAM